MYSNICLILFVKQENNAFHTKFYISALGMMFFFQNQMSKLRKFRYDQSLQLHHPLGLHYEENTIVLTKDECFLSSLIFIYLFYWLPSIYDNYSREC